MLTERVRHFIRSHYFLSLIYNQRFVRCVRRAYRQPILSSRDELFLSLF
jgi:hypothetical protein